MGLQTRIILLRALFECLIQLFLVAGKISGMAGSTSSSSFSNLYACPSIDRLVMGILVDFFTYFKLNRAEFNDTSNTFAITTQFYALARRAYDLWDEGLVQHDKEQLYIVTSKSNTECVAYLVAFVTFYPLCLMSLQARC